MFVTLQMKTLLALLLATVSGIFGQPYSCPTAPITAEQQVVNLTSDWGLHPQYASEWYYVTGNLLSLSNSQKVGYQLTTFFNHFQGFTPVENQFSDFAVSTPAGHYAASVNGVGTATLPFNVHFTSPSLDMSYKLVTGTAGHVGSSYKFEGKSHNITTGATIAKIDVSLIQLTPAMLQGTNGYYGIPSPSPYACLSYYYYSLPLLLTTGTIEYGSNKYIVGGVSWLDHQYGGSPAFPGSAPASWIWSGLHLSVGDVMIVVPRYNNAGTYLNLYDYSLVELQDIFGTLIKGKVTNIVVSTYWTSPKSGIVYPSTIIYTTTIPSLQSITVTPVYLDQEIGGVNGGYYWEGTSTVTGTATGTGYLELVGFPHA